MSVKNHNIGEYTTAEAAELVGDITSDRVRQIAKSLLKENVDYKKFGRTMVILEAGIKKIKARNTKPGPQSANGRKAA